LNLFSRLAAAEEETVSIKLGKNQVFLKNSRATISAALVEANFPNYNDVIPRDCDKEAEIDTAVLLSGLRRAALLTNEESRGVRLAFEKNKLTLSSRAPEQGEATINLPARYTAAPITVGFNPVFLIDALRAAHTDRVVIGLKEPQKPGVLQVGEEFLYVVMPVNL